VIATIEQQWSTAKLIGVTLTIPGSHCESTSVRGSKSILPILCVLLEQGVGHYLGNQRLCYNTLVVSARSNSFIMLRVHVTSEKASTTGMPSRPVFSQLFVPHNNKNTIKNIYLTVILF
jgi:hypothetical protein